MPVRVKWFVKQFERQKLDPAIVRWLNKIGARGEAISKKLIGGPGPLHAVDKGFLLNSISWVIDPPTFRVRIGTYIARSDGKPLTYAIFVFMGWTSSLGKVIPAKPVLRTMLAMLRIELK